MSDVSDLKDPKTLAAEFNSIEFCNPVAICSISNHVEYITNMAFHSTGTCKPVLISSINTFLGEDVKSSQTKFKKHYSEYSR